MDFLGWLTIPPSLKMVGLCAKFGNNWSEIVDAIVLTGMCTGICKSI